MSLKKVDWKSPTVIGVLVFVILGAFFLSKEAKAETTFELGPVMAVSGNRYEGAYLAIEERFKDKYAVGVGLTTPWTCTTNCKYGNGDSNQFFYVQRVVQYKSLEWGVGASFWRNQTPSWNSNTPFALSFGWNITDHLNVKWRHFSTAGTSSRNGGLDLVTIGWRF